jgi:hypothetical protein
MGAECADQAAVAFFLQPPTVCKGLHILASASGCDQQTGLAKDVVQAPSLATWLSRCQFQPVNTSCRSSHRH